MPHAKPRGASSSRSRLIMLPVLDLEGKTRAEMLAELDAFARVLDASRRESRAHLKRARAREERERLRARLAFIEQVFRQWRSQMHIVGSMQGETTQAGEPRR